MRSLTIIAMISIVAVSDGATIKRCSCWEGYKPEIIHGNLQCQGVYVEHTMACDVIPPPKCVCTGHNGILKDRLGTWCTIYLKGIEVKRWKCENYKEWEDFFRRLQNQQQQQHQQQQQQKQKQKQPKPRG